MKNQELSFQFKDLTLRGVFCEPEANTKNQAVLFLHGWTGTENANAAAFLAKNGYYAMTFSLPGHNNSDGDINTLTRAKSYDAVCLALESLKSRIPENMPIAVVGNSYGGYMAALVSGSTGVNAISLRVPANYPDAKFDQRQMGQGSEDPDIMKWRQKLHDHTETRALRALHAFTGKVQIIEAELDDAVPHETVQSYAHAVSDPSNLEFHLLQGWPHSLGIDPERNKQFQTVLYTWLESL